MAYDDDYDLRQQTSKAGQLADLRKSLVSRADEWKHWGNPANREAAWDSIRTAFAANLIDVNRYMALVAWFKKSFADSQASKRHVRKRPKYNRAQNQMGDW